jgi:HD-like signal output (HDOD) protein
MSDTILVLSPLAPVAHQMAAPLQENGFTVYIATDVCETIKKLGQGDCAMFIVDIRLAVPPVIGLLSSLRKSMPWLALGIFFPMHPVRDPRTALENAGLNCALFEETVSAELVTEFLQAHHEALQKKNYATQLGLNAEQMPEIRVNYEAADMVLEVVRILGILVQRPNLSVPVAPWVMDSLIPALECQAVQSDEVLQLILLDAGLVYLLFQAANAADDVPPVRDVHEALERLGEEKARTLLLEEGEKRVFMPKLEGLAEMFRIQWMHNFACSFSNDLYAKLICLDTAKECHLMGLLHDVGMSVILQLLEEGYQNALWTQRLCGKDNFLMRVVTGNQHAQFSAAVLDSCHFEPLFAQVALECDAPKNLLTSPDSVILTFFSNQLARKCGYDLVVYDSEADPVNRADVRKQLNMDPNAYLKIEKSLRANITSTCKQFNLPGGGGA